jgi:hypothetical protein
MMQPWYVQRAKCNNSALREEALRRPPTDRAAASTGRGSTPYARAFDPSSPSGRLLPILPHLRRDWAHPCHICAGTGLTPATSAPGLGHTTATALRTAAKDARQALSGNYR